MGINCKWLHFSLDYIILTVVKNKEIVRAMERKNVILPKEEMERQQQFMLQVNHLFGERPHKYILQTFGCQMNENDSEKLAGMLREMGYVPATSTEDCDLILFNTCCVRENAEEKVYGHLGALKKLHQENPNLVIALCGCMMQQETVQQEIKKKYKQVDLVFGTHNLYQFPELLHQVLQNRKSIMEVWDSAGTIVEGMPIERESTVKAWVTIMYGCNNFCTYCIVPYVRGRERSRMPSEIIKEIEYLVKHGVKEVTLLGQNVNSYCGFEDGKEVSFPELLHQIQEVEGLERIRFMTSHPKDLSPDLIQAMKHLPKVCKQLHLPMQSGSSRVLKEMNRRYTKEQYLQLVADIKREIPDITLSTDIIVGFPGETEEDFAETLDVVAKAEFDMAYTFLYSRRTGTPAAKAENQVPEAVMKERFDRLVALQTENSRKQNDPLAGKVVTVLCEGPSKSNPEKLTGRTDGNKIVNFSGDANLKGKMLEVLIENVQTWSLEGTIQKVIQ